MQATIFARTTPLLAPVMEPAGAVGGAAGAADAPADATLVTDAFVAEGADFKQAFANLQQGIIQLKTVETASQTAAAQYAELKAKLAAAIAERDSAIAERDAAVNELDRVRNLVREQSVEILRSPVPALPVPETPKLSPADLINMRVEKIMADVRVVQHAAFPDAIGDRLHKKFEALEQALKLFLERTDIKNTRSQVEKLEHILRSPDSSATDLRGKLHEIMRIADLINNGHRISGVEIVHHNLQLETWNADQANRRAHRVTTTLNLRVDAMEGNTAIEVKSLLMSDEFCGYLIKYLDPLTCSQNQIAMGTLTHTDLLDIEGNALKFAAQLERYAAAINSRKFAKLELLLTSSSRITQNAVDAIYRFFERETKKTDSLKIVWYDDNPHEIEEYLKPSPIPNELWDFAFQSQAIRDKINNDSEVLQLFLAWIIEKNYWENELAALAFEQREKRMLELISEWRPDSKIKSDPPSSRNQVTDEHAAILLGAYFEQIKDLKGKTIAVDFTNRTITPPIVKTSYIITVLRSIKENLPAKQGSNKLKDEINALITPLTLEGLGRRDSDPIFDIITYGAKLNQILKGLIILNARRSENGADSKK